MTTLYHLADAADWAAARSVGSYQISTRGVTLAEQGFIHCSLDHQAQGIADVVFDGVDEVVLLVVDSDRLTVPVRYEPGQPGGAAYPHIYGPLPVDAVVESIPIRRGPDGRLALPLP